MNILALDLGTNTGWASGMGYPQAGTWTLATTKEIAMAGKTRMRRRHDPRVIRLFDNLRAHEKPDLVIFEDIAFASSTYQVQLWASLRGAVWCAFSCPPPIIECVNSATLKKFATGHGGATKQMMAASLFKLWPRRKRDNLSDDAIDALWLWRWAETHLKKSI